jgi:hypothetical protein
MFVQRLGRSSQILQTSHAVDVAHDFDAVPENAMEDEIVAHGKVTHAGSDIIARHAHLRISGKCVAFLVESIDQPICRSRLSRPI